VAADEVHQESARHLAPPTAADALDADLQRVEAEVDVLIEQLLGRAGVGVHAEEHLEGERRELPDSARAQFLLGEAVGQREPRQLRADAVDLPSDPSLLAEERDALKVASHVACRAGTITP